MMTTPPAIPPLNVRLCRRASALAGFSGVAFLLVNAVMWIVPDWAETVARGTSGLTTEPITLTPLVRVLALVLTTAFGAILVRGLWIVRALFKRLANGMVFEPETGSLLRRFGRALVIYAVLTPFVGAITCVLVTMNNAPGERRFELGLSDHEVVLAVVGVLILVIGSVMAEAAKIVAENREIV